MTTVVEYIKQKSYNNDDVVTHFIKVLLSTPFSKEAKYAILCLQTNETTKILKNQCDLMGV